MISISWNKKIQNQLNKIMDCNKKLNNFKNKLNFLNRKLKKVI